MNSNGVGSWADPADLPVRCGSRALAGALPLCGGLDGLSSWTQPRCLSRSPVLALPRIELTSLVDLDNSVGVTKLPTRLGLGFKVPLYTRHMGR